MVPPLASQSLLRSLPADAIHQLMLQAIFSESLDPIRPLLEGEIARRRETAAKDDSKMLNLLRVEPCRAARELAKEWRKQARDGERWVEIWRGDGLVLKYGTSLLELASMPNERLLSHIARDAAQITVGPQSASVDWEGGGLSLDRMTAEALIATGMKSRDSAKLAELCSALMANVELERVLAGSHST